MKNAIIKKKLTASERATLITNAWVERYCKLSDVEIKKCPPTKAGFRHDNSFTYDQLQKYKQNDKTFRVAYEKAETLIAAYYERSLLRGGNHLSGVMFLLKTTFHYRENDKSDNQQVNITLDLSSAAKGDNEI